MLSDAAMLKQYRNQIKMLENNLKEVRCTQFYSYAYFNPQPFSKSLKGYATPNVDTMFFSVF